MQRLIEAILGLERGVLSQKGEYALTFDPAWPGVGVFPPLAWNLLITALAVALIVHVYRRESGSPRFRVFSATVRLILMLVVLLLLNRPMLSLTQTRTEPSVLAVLVDDSLSMQVADVDEGKGGKPVPRLEAAKSVLTAGGGTLLEELAQKHVVKVYRFSSGVVPVGVVTGAKQDPEEVRKEAQAVAGEVEQVKAAGQSTRVMRAVRETAEQLHGQRLAGVVLFTDGREMPAATADPAALRDLGTRVYPVPVGSEGRLRNVRIDGVRSQDVAFKGDMVAVRAQVGISGLDAGTPVEVVLKKADGTPMLDADGHVVRASVPAGSEDERQDVDLVFRAQNPGVLDLVVDVEGLPGEITTDDNSRALQLTVLDAKINLLYVEGLPRWEYRYLKTQMTRDKSMGLSILLTSADPGYAQEGSKPIRFFPQTMDQLLEYDVLLLGDVDPRQFTDAQLGMIRDFVTKKGGGLGMIAGPKFSPQAWRGTPVEQALPVDISAAKGDDRSVAAFRPVLTAEGSESPIFRFFADRKENDLYLKQGLQPLYWFSQGVTARPAVSEVLAEHPTITGPDGKRAPILVVGRPGAGRSLFSAIDDSWRWRYYTGESIFDTYWVQQIRYLARGRKVGQRRMSFAAVQQVHEVGEQVQLELRVIDDQLAAQLPDAVGVEVADANGRLMATETLHRQGTRKDLFRALVPATEIGRFTAKLPSVAAGVPTMSTTYEVIVPRLELSDPRPARSSLSQMAGVTDGAVIDLAKVVEGLKAIPSAARVVPVQTTWPLWSAPLLLGLIALLLTSEWVARKMAGLL